MPLNMELKAKIVKPNNLPEMLIHATNTFGTTGAEVIDQKDIFFGTLNEGTLLKLRIEENRTHMRKKNVLVAYTREVSPDAKPSEYILTQVADVPTMIEALTMSNGKLGEVYKTRHVFKTTRNGLHARIHLDLVRGLGDYVEFEVQMQDRFQTAFAKEFAAYLCHVFGIKEKDYVAGAYFELKLKKIEEQEEAEKKKAEEEAERKNVEEASGAGK